MPLSSGPQHWKTTKRLGGKAVDLLGKYGCTRDPRAALFGYDGEPEGSEGVHPEFPNLGKFSSGTADDGIVDVSEDMNGEGG